MGGWTVLLSEHCVARRLESVSGAVAVAVSGLAAGQ